MVRRLLSIVSFIEHPAKTIDAVRAWVQQYKMLNLPRDWLFVIFELRLKYKQKHTGKNAARLSEFEIRGKRPSGQCI